MDLLIFKTSIYFHVDFCLFLLGGFLSVCFAVLVVSFRASVVLINKFDPPPARIL